MHSGCRTKTLPPQQIPETVEMTAARLGRGTYTDDTQMMIALADAVIEDEPLDPERLAQRFVERFDPKRGYGRGTTQVLADDIGEAARCGPNPQPAAHAVAGEADLSTQPEQSETLSISWLARRCAGC